MSSPAYDLNQYLNGLADEDKREERIDALAAEYAKDPAKRAEADEYMSGTLPEWWYANIEGVLADFFIGGDAAAAAISRLSMYAHDARAERIRWLAERDIAANQEPEL